MRSRPNRHSPIAFAALLVVAGLSVRSLAQNEDLLLPQGPSSPSAPVADGRMPPRNPDSNLPSNTVPSNTGNAGSGINAGASILGSALPVPDAPAPRDTGDVPTDYLQLEARAVTTFDAGDTQIIQIDNPVTIRTPETTITATSAIMWVSREAGSPLNRQRVQLALIGNATLTQPGVVRTGDKLFVTILVGGPLRMAVQDRLIGDPRGSELYKDASDIRPMLDSGADVEDHLVLQRPWIDIPTSQPTTQATTKPTPVSPVTFTAGDVQTTTATPDGKIAAILRGGVLLLQHRPDGSLVELQSQSCVLFTSLSDFRQLQGGTASLQSAINSAYLEGDVRINFTPAPSAHGIVSNHELGEQRMRADRAYYEFSTDRAVMTDAVVQSRDPRLPFPITIRANAVKQLAAGEYDTQHTTITTSQFANPSYAVNASKMYIRQHNDNDGYGQKTDYVASNAVYRLFDVPVFYLPYAAGEMTQNAQVLRNLELGSRRGFGFGAQTEWGLFESLGRLPPPGIDATYNLDYFTDRGPAAGFETKYKGGFIEQTTKEGWNFDGDFRAYGIQDSGNDNLGRYRSDVPANGDYSDKFRGRVEWEHQHILPDDWQLQLRLGYASDATFMEEFFQKDFDDGLPTDLEAYAKHQTNTEALTFLLQFQPNSVVTNADSLHNRFISTDGPLSDRPFEVDRLPEVGYYRLGDALDDDQLTYFSENRVGGYVMAEANDPLGYDSTSADPQNINYGFREGFTRDRVSTVGIPSAGYTGTTGKYVIRADSRQEIDWPLDAGQFKVVPYVMGRYTGWTDSPDSDPQNRILAGAGLRATTAFWKVDDSAESDFWDIHRIRHVIEPEVNLFASGSSVDRNNVYIYDQTIDGVNDISAASFWIRQRWETKRGGPGLWRSVDFLTFDVGIIGVANKPDFPQNDFRAAADAFNATGQGTEDVRQIGPLSAQNFRGVYFQSTPEASLPHSALAMNATWRIADTTLLLSDANLNLDHQDLATAAIGLLAGRGDRVTYYTGVRYIGLINSTVASFSVTYQLTLKYSINAAVAIDLDKTSSKGGSFSVIRRFDRFYIGAGAYYDAVENTSGLIFQFIPEGLQGSLNSNQLASVGK